MKFVFGLYIFIAVFLAGCSGVQTSPEGRLSYSDAQKLSYALDVGMAESEITELFGLPDRTEMSTCGANSGGKSWSCRILTYQYGRGYSKHRIRAYFQQVNGIWYLNSWDWLDF